LSAPDALVSVKVGRFALMMYGSNKLTDIYLDSPDYNGELGRLVSASIQKYPDLGLIDIGAHCGDTAAIAKSSADIPILCIEGDERVHELLIRNVKQFSGIATRRAFLGENVEEVALSVEDESGSLMLVPNALASEAKIALTTLDACAMELPDIDRYHLMKVDTEGFDCRILRGGMGYIRRVKPIIMMEYHRKNLNRNGENGLDTLEQLRDEGYHDVLFYDNGGRLLTTATLDQIDLVRDLHEYADGYNGAIFYYDLCIFHSRDADIASRFSRSERGRRVNKDILSPS
jgi:FkbM family methyltransferase